ncbi:tRNA pseudouridine(13) synthase TruD [Methanogenium organophilum]|uniref:Probable tRNA pseudouridine synthase D n=1 Tax=Methanogenium organophilum TaxID=2199 RepID=A0A9X9S489_METOG|nr:tRNA pseudouridine(13) synthase TruD [Methanogenium organophilum]WAI01251.1 tRNA pseudouridine(13) synthase TruD [Methanogenium organophilum]
MKLSPYPIEQSLGMQYYVCNSEGIQGVLREEAEDFIVHEISNEVKSSEESTGKYLICRLEKKNWELQRAVKEIAKILGVSHRRISWAGTKDKHAVTDQLISIYDVSETDIQNIQLKDITLTPVGRSNQQISLGDLQGNRFEITIRSCRAADIAASVAETNACVAEGVPNYFGIQRFGVQRPVTHLVGKQILLDRYDEAVNTYVGFPSEGEDESVAEARKAFLSDGDPKAALETLPVQMRYERAILHHLTEVPHDYEGALKRVPPKLLSMFVSAYQSWLFNQGLSHRIEVGHPLSAPALGDRVLFQNGKKDIVGESNINQATVLVKRGRAHICLEMPGEKTNPTHSTAEQHITTLMEADGISYASFKKAGEMTGMSFKGAVRRISVSAPVTSDVCDDTVHLSFSLGPGQYATTICREYMKADPIRMI